MEEIERFLATCSESFVSHARSVASKFTPGTPEYLVALLHDVVEDGELSFAQCVERFKLSNEQAKALDNITRRDGELYFDYIRRVNTDEMARAIKVSELAVNIKRSGELSTLRRRYSRAILLLCGHDL